MVLECLKELYLWVLGRLLSVGVLELLRGLGTRLMRVHLLELGLASELGLIVGC